MACCEIMVVGAGPAGSTLSRLLAEAGRNVLLIDKAVFPRRKPCAGGMPRRTLDFLDIDVPGEMLSPVDSVALDGAWSGRGIYDDGIDCVVVERSRFDSFLVERAVAAGVEFRPGCGIKYMGAKRKNGGFEVRTGEGDFSCDIVCACDGVFSPTGRSLGFAKNDTGFCVEADVWMKPGIDPRAMRRAVFNMKCVRGGYGWAFPCGEVFHAGVGGDMKDSRRMRGYLAEFIAATPELSGAESENLIGGAIPDFRVARDEYASGGAYLVGDAAGLVDPLTGEGIYYAVKSAALAARAILEGGEAEYDSAIKSQIVPDLKVAAFLRKRFVRMPTWLRGAMMSFPGFGRAARKMVAVLSGKMSYRDLMRRK